MENETEQQPFNLVEWRPYKCSLCGKEQALSTNHTLKCYAYCQGCSWKGVGFGPGVYMFGALHREHVYDGNSA